MTLLHINILLLCYFTFLVQSAKILVFSPTVSRSHMISCGRIADELAKAEHNVTIFEPDFLHMADAVVPVKVAKRWIVKGFGNEFKNVLQSFSKTDVFSDGNTYSVHKNMYDYGMVYNAYCKSIFNNDELMEQLRNEKFDAYFGEHLNLCGPSLAYHLGIKVRFFVASCPLTEGQAYFLGHPYPLSIVPAGTGKDYPMKNPTFLERAHNLVHGLVNIYFNSYVDIDLTSFLRSKYGSDFPDAGSIAADSDLIFVATDEFIEVAKPTMPNVVHVGGLGLTDNHKPLDQTFAEEMSKGKKGVVYISFGTIVNTTSLPLQAKESLVHVADSFPDYHFMLRVDHNDKVSKQLAKDVPNLQAHDWLPQPAILAHPRLKMFVTHAGYNGIMEAAKAGVPLVSMPFMFDQIKSSRLIESRGWGIHVHRKCLIQDVSPLKKAIRTILEDEKYKKAALRVQKLIKEKPFNSSERFVKYTNFVLEQGGIKEWLSEGRNISTIVYYNLDVLAVFASLFVVVSYVTLRFISKFLGKV